MARFMEIKSMNPKLTQKEVAEELGYSTSRLKRYRRDINMLSPYRIPTKSCKRRQKISNDDTHKERDGKRHQLTSKEPTYEKDKFPKIKKNFERRIHA